MEKKMMGFIIIGIVAGLGSGLGIGYLLFTPASQQEQTTAILYGSGAGPSDLDPQFAWDSASIDVIDQVFEGLYRYDLSNPYCPIEPWLAVDEGAWSADSKELTVSLRQGVKFHDGWDFNATAVKFTFDRLNYLCNSTGARDADTLTQIAELYTYNSTDILYSDFTNNQTIINRVEIISTYMVKFVLNCTYPAFKALLCFSGSYILSPNPASTPATDFIAITSKIYGTGPYIYDSYVTDTEVRFHSNDNWWVNPVVKPISLLRFVIIADAATRNNAMLAGDINFIQDPLPGMISTFNTSTTTKLVNTHHYNWIEQYLGMNTVLINATWRKAISYAFDYDYMLNTIMNGYAVRLESPIPNGIPMSNYTLDVATLDLSIARQTMVAMGYGSLGWSDATWRAQAASAPFRTLNYTYNTDNDVRTKIGTLLVNNLAALGIKVELNGVTWTVFKQYMYDRAPHNRMQMDMHFVGWAPDYVDPSDFINPIYSPVSMSNSVLLDDPYVNANMTMALFESDPVVRQNLYNTIQKYLIEELRPYIWCYQGLNFDVVSLNLKGFQSNPMGKVYFATCFFA